MPDIFGPDPSDFGADAYEIDSAGRKSRSVSVTASHSLDRWRPEWTWHRICSMQVGPPAAVMGRSSESLSGESGIRGKITKFTKLEDINMRSYLKTKGFTLIELMIVVAIIAILAAIALPAYQDYLIRSQVSEGLVLASGARSAIWDFNANTGRLPPNNRSAGLPAAASIAGKYVSSVTIAAGLVTVLYGNEANAQIATQTLLLSPLQGEGSLLWSCTSTTLSGKYLPTSCRQ